MRLAGLHHPLLAADPGWRSGFMSAPRCFSYRDGNILVSSYQVILPPDWLRDAILTSDWLSGWGLCWTWSTSPKPGINR